MKFVQHYNDEKMGILKLMRTAAKGFWTAAATVRSNVARCWLEQYFISTNLGYMTFIF